jgi:hypothetical protein
MWANDDSVIGEPISRRRSDTNNVVVPIVPLFKQVELPQTLIGRPSGSDRFLGIGFNSV